MNDQTNYSKKLMEDLQGQIGQKSAKYEELVNALDGKIREMKNYWLEGDADAEGLYTQLLDQFNKFKAELDEGHDLMKRFQQQVGNQIGRYQDAEAQTRSAIGN